MYWYEKNNENSLFSNEKYIKHECITDYILDKFRKKYFENISKEDIFYYVYALLNSKDYKLKFESDLKKSLPKIPLVDKYELFKNYSDAGKKLAELHLNYEKIKPYNKCNITAYTDATYKVTKMKFSKKGDKSSIDYNDRINISNIPLKAYEYVVNGKSPIEWIMERYAVTIDKKSGIKNDPNDWCDEKNDEKYIFNLLLRIINISIQTVDIVNSLPKIDFD